MAPSEFVIQLQKGIVGGFAPPSPSLIIQIVNDNGDLQITAVKPPDELDTASKTVTTADHEALIDELHGILKTLPTEDPPGSEDIYGLDTSISWASEDLEWQNDAPKGCGGDQSDVQPDDQQKKDFERAVEIIKEIAGEE